MPFDAGIAESLPRYAPDGGTEYELWDDSKFSVDLYDPDRRIAVEIEKSEVENIWKDLAKFARGALQEDRSRIRYSCLILPVNYSTSRTDHNLFKASEHIVRFTQPLTKVGDIAVIGYRDPRPDADV